mmetsp:Transcript_2282/g.6490  ORF Transcript_2282/g.6490 Transcript_2282/m.6490 type:complete len:225 (+) Transcript_2282:217-891(+)
MLRRASLFALASSARALVAPPPARTERAARLKALTTPDIVSAFGRMAESTCVAEDGKSQTSAKPKWIPAYAERGGHVPAWRTHIFGDNDVVDFDGFQAGLEAMEYEDGLHAPPSAAARSYRAPGGAAAWILCGGGDADLKLADCAAALLELSPEKDGVHWSDFDDAARELEKERITDWALFKEDGDDWEASLSDDGSGQLLTDVGVATPPAPDASSGAPPPPPH